MTQRALLGVAYLVVSVSCGGDDGAAPDAAPPDAEVAPHWRGEERIDTGEGNAAYPQVAADSNGNAIAVWRQGTAEIWANRSVLGSGWGQAELVATGSDGTGQPQVAVDPEGNAIAAWFERSGSQVSYFASRYAVGSGWGTAELIVTDVADETYGPRLAVDANGNAFASWYLHDGTSGDTWVSRYVAGTGWGTPEVIDTNDIRTSAASLAVDPAGNAFALWTAGDFFGREVWANRYEMGSGWGTPELLATALPGGGHTVSSGNVAVDAAGNAIAVWCQYFYEGGTTWANRYVVGAGWATARMLEPGDTEDSSDPRVAVDVSGDAIAVWQHRSAIWATRYAGGAWGATETISSDTTEAELPRIEVDASGNAVAVWEQGSSILANLYNADSGWGTAVPIEISDEVAGSHQLAVGPAGNAIAVWLQSSGVWANRYE